VVHLLQVIFVIFRTRHRRAEQRCVGAAAATCGTGPANAGQPSGGDGSGNTGPVASPAANAPQAAAAPATIAPAKPVNVAVKSDSQERTIVVENSLYRVEISNRGAVVKSWQLKNYKDDAKPQRVLDVVHRMHRSRPAAGPFPWCSMMNSCKMPRTQGFIRFPQTRPTCAPPPMLTSRGATATWKSPSISTLDHTYVVA